MTNKKPLTPNQVKDYVNLTIPEIEEILSEVREDKSSAAQLTRRVATQALSQRQRTLKASVMSFEATNDHHLLIYNSTANFAKIAGNSVLFFSALIAPRLHWRFSIKPDTDHYSPSADGIISIRSLENLALQLAQIQVLPDPNLNSPDLHYFTLPKIYTDAQISAFREHILKESERIAAVVMPSSPMPDLHRAIKEANRLIYFRFKHLPDAFAREAVGLEITRKAYELFLAYLTYANTPKSQSLPYLKRINELAHSLRNSMAYLSELKILPSRDVYRILDQLAIAVRLSGQALRRLTKINSTEVKQNV